MNICRECGEDLKLTWDHISICDNNDCDLNFKKDKVNLVDHLERQILLNNEMNK